MASNETLYRYMPSHILPTAFAALVGISFLLHDFQNLFWRVTFWWAGSSAVPPATAQTTCICILPKMSLFILHPPVYSAAAYNIVGRLMN
ncbi:hypothetical protein N7470_004329 [Penicillium chermesinum]|nr:hypothetical protein N7470_004329 [Penicillium chermesinum]